MRRLALGLSLLTVGAWQLSVVGDDGAHADADASSARAAVERGIRGCANRNRRARSLGPLRPSRALARAARLQARSMARHGYFDHTDPRGRDVGDRVRIFDRGRRFDHVGENIAAGYRSAPSACRGWMSSAGHRANILTPDYTHIGGGFARGGPLQRYYVQVLGSGKPALR